MSDEAAAELVKASARREDGRAVWRTWRREALEELSAIIHG